MAECWGQRIHMLTTGGEFIGTFGVSGSGIGQFWGPLDVKISPDGRVYVADWGNHRVQVFNPDWTISHVIDNSSVPGRFSYPTAIAFDLLGNVYVANDSNAVSVFTPSGQFIQHYGRDGVNTSSIAIDPSGYSLLFDRHTLSVYNPSGSLVHTIGGFKRSTGVSISPDGSVWIADSNDNRLVQL